MSDREPDGRREQPGVSPENMRFMEIEHKHVVGEGFDLDRFRQLVQGLHPIRSGTVRVSDRYFLTEGGRSRRFLFRHRYDTELHHLTIKALEEDAEVRVEINLDLGHHAGSQDAQVEAFVGQLGVVWSGTLHKDLEVWYFEDCEVVYYNASTAVSSVRCVEFEATNARSLDEALEVVRRFECATGFEGSSRSQRSLPQILFPELEQLLTGR